MKREFFRFFSFLFIVFIASISLHGQKNEVASVLFSWDKAGDVMMVVKYKDEELQPLGGLHFHTSGYHESQMQIQLRKVTHMGQLLAGNCYRNNRVKFNWWEYFKSFFWEPKQAGYQKLTLFDDGQDLYEGRGGMVERLFRKEVNQLLSEFEILQQLRA